METILKCFFGPRLFRIHRSPSHPGHNYEANILESGGNKVISTLRFCWSLSYWTSPVLLTILYRRGYFTSEGLQSIGKFLTYAAIFYISAIFMRGIGRFTNPDYVAFSGVLMAATRAFNGQNRRLLSGYDFEFRAWPVNFRWDQVNIGEVKKMKIQASKPKPSRSGLNLMAIPCNMFSYVAAHTFGRRMVYPGATSLMNAVLEPMLCQGRAKLVEEQNGLRAKLLTEDKNEIDTMFIDKRSSVNPKGKTLVVCSEGNAGFYEIGATGTPMDAGYSVLGWNHPGFAGSSGAPLPSQEQNAIDTVMQYSIHQLGFTPDNIIVYAWSIGGYTATWAAMNYPDIQAVILDATFDDLVPLAVARMPASFKELVGLTVRQYLNLNNAEQLIKYHGPVLLIRRTRDEMITTHPQLAIHSNRGNGVLIKLLQNRYPEIVDSSTLPLLEEWLATDKAGHSILQAEKEVDYTLCQVMIRSYIEENPDATFPLQIGEGLSQEQKEQLTLFLAAKHMEDFDSTHCTPLPTSFFHQPWSPWNR